MKKPLITFFILTTILLFSGCAIRTPQINGLVLDEETKQPVPDAWVTSDIELNVNTAAGKVNYVFSVAQPHTRTDKEGRFVIPPKEIEKTPFPLSFGTDVISFGIHASTSDYRGGGVDIKDKLGTWGNAEVTIYLVNLDKVDERDIAAYIKDGVKEERAKEIIEGEQFSALQALYNYCTTGRLTVETPAVEGGCDDWELDYAIRKHERFLGRFGEPNNDQISHHSIVMEQLAYLYEKNNNYRKSLEYYQKVKEFDEKNGIKMSLNKYKRKINELQKKLEQNTK